MDGNLVIVESPSKAVTIQKFLGKDYVVKSSFGHIRDLQGNKLSVDIEHDFRPEYTVPTDKKKIVADLKKAADNAGTIWLASDEDREGEAISWHLFETLGLKKDNTRRIVFHEITKEAILNAIANPRNIDMNLVDAQQARRVLDRLVGFELSPVLWRKIKPKLSAGRVQSVALRLVVAKEKEIMAFKSEPYYKITAVFHPDNAPAVVKVNAILDSRFKDMESAEKFLEDSIGASFSVGKMEEKEGTRCPAPPFTTSTLQQEASRKLHFPVNMTMRVAQQLYERGLITYMRTDSTNLSNLALGTSKKYVTENFGAEYSKTRQYKTHSKGAQEAHEAIRPTFIANTDIEGSAQEKKLYNLIWKRTIASQMADAKILTTSIKVDSDKRPEKFGIQAKQILFDGFLKVYMESSDEPSSDDDEVILPKINIGEKLEAKEISAECKFTQAPSRYSEATLVKKLEELGIGRPSTYAPTISTLTTGRGYIIKGDKEGEKIKVTNLSLKKDKISKISKTEIKGAEKGRLIPQEIGMIVTDFLVKNFDEILDYDFTADIEKELDEIAEGRKKWNSLIASFYSPFHKRVEETLNNHEYSHVSKELGKDPSDGLEITAKYGKFGPYVQKGDGENKQFASLGRGQLIETITLEDALNLFKLPRTVGQYKDTDVIALKGRFGPYLKFGDKNFSLPRGYDPVSITLEECTEIIDAGLNRTPANKTISEYKESGILVLNGKYGPYIKYDNANYRIPKGTDPSSLSEEKCKEIIKDTKPTGKNRRIQKK
ncbi:MAG: type I DNA topoisomerase [Bacteroidales bacterium]|jgi:DNA topoisomerase-1|nr:type I DNA topoisomerase [Bacteroidales bacterium]MCI1784946.1 type I DNA topoisomerase [Bacteroidales bacterium]